jgi:hypothetical protein
MHSLFIKIGLILKSIDGFWWFLTTVAPTVLVFSLGIYEKIGLTYSVALTFVMLTAGVFFAIGIKVSIEMFRPTNKLISLLFFLQIASKKGWNILGKDSLEIIDIADALREAGSNGDLIFYGREVARNVSETIAMNKPRLEIPQEVWRDYSIQTLAAVDYNGQKKFAEDNYSVLACNLGDRDQVQYKDLHVYSRNAEKWIKATQKYFKGRRQIQKNERDKHLELLNDMME